MPSARIHIRHTEPRDFEGVERLSRIVYPNDFPWTADYLTKHLEMFPEGQFVAADSETGEVVGMAAGLIIRWEDYDEMETYLDVTDGGWFTNHDPGGRTLYGAEVMVDPGRRGEGIGSALYASRKELVRRLGLHRIRAGARLPGYHAHADKRSAEEYVRKVIAGQIQDATLSFQLRHDFRVLGVVADYFARDPRSRGFAALIEWLNEDAVGSDARSAHEFR